MRTSPSRKRPISDAALPASLWLAGGIHVHVSVTLTSRAIAIATICVSCCRLSRLSKPGELPW